MATSGQTLNDRINAARYALAGQGLARYVCKATTEEVLGPKKKHLDYLLACTHEANVSIPQLANLLIERTNHISWVVVFKALVTVHHLMSYGNERFIQYLASSNYSFELSTFLDKTSARDFSMSTFIRRYSRYINEKALSYRLLAFDFCKIKRGNEGVLRQMPIDRLLKTLPILQNQLDALLEFNCTVGDLNNGVIISCFMLLFRDLIGLFACHEDGIINLLNKYFTLNKKMCREAFDLYKKYPVRVDKVNDFLRVAEAVGLDKDDIPDLRRTPSSLIDNLEQHLQNLESNKKILKNYNSNNNSSSTSSKLEFSSVLDNPTPPSSSTIRPSSPVSANITGGAGITSKVKSSEETVTISSFKDDEVKKALEEEARVLSLYGTNGNGLGEPKSSSRTSALENLKFSPTATGQEAHKISAHTTPKTIDDIFGDADAFANAVIDNNNRHSFSNSNNGLLDMPFDKAVSSATSRNTSGKEQGMSKKPDLGSIRLAIQSATTTLEQASSKPAGSISSRGGGQKASDDLFNLLDSVESSGANPNPSKSGAEGVPTNNLTQNLMGSFAAKPNNFNAPNYSSLAGIEGFGDVLQPTSTSSKTVNGKNTTSTSKAAFASSAGLPSTGLFKGDLDSTLASLAQNLTFEGISKNKK